MLDYGIKVKYVFILILIKHAGVANTVGWLTIKETKLNFGGFHGFYRNIENVNP